MNKILITIGILFCCHATAASAETPSEPTVIAVEDLSWSRPPNIPGLQVVWLLGAESEHGLYTVRVKLDPGAIIPPHTHIDERNTVVLQGDLYVGFGETFDAANAVKISAGSMYVAPAGVAHFIWAKDGSVIYQEVGVGPSSTSLISSE